MNHLEWFTPVYRLDYGVVEVYSSGNGNTRYKFVLSTVLEYTTGYCIYCIGEDGDMEVWRFVHADCVWYVCVFVF